MNSKENNNDIRLVIITGLVMYLLGLTVGVGNIYITSERERQIENKEYVSTQTNWTYYSK